MCSRLDQVQAVAESLSIVLCSRARYIGTLSSWKYVITWHIGSKILIALLILPKKIWCFRNFQSFILWSWLDLDCIKFGNSNSDFLMIRANSWQIVCKCPTFIHIYFLYDELAEGIYDKHNHKNICWGFPLKFSKLICLL